ncbi:MAG: P-II family nitrogen regulator [Thermoplasmata archaeon]|nr:P-II family nitrogen regulator [Thermoplasmata archaeon]
MKMIIAIVRPEKAQEVKDAIHEAGFNGMTITHVTGRGRQAGLKFSNRFGEIVVDEIEKTKFEIVVDDKDVRSVINTVCKTAATGNHGDGKIFVVPVEESYTISDFAEKEDSKTG